MSSRFLHLTFVLPACLILTACGMSTTGSDAAGPALLTISPQGGTQNVNRIGPMVMRFDGAMGAGMERYMDLHHGDMAGPTHPMTCTWSQDRTTVTCVPNQPLDPQTGYAMHLGGGLRGMNGMAARMTEAATMGGESVNGGMHAGQPMSMMGNDWKAPDGTYGMMFRFRTGP